MNLVFVCVLFSSFFILFLRAERLDGGFGVRFRVLALVFVFVRCFGGVLPVCFGFVGLLA